MKSLSREVKVYLIGLLAVAISLVFVNLKHSNLPGNNFAHEVNEFAAHSVALLPAILLIWLGIKFAKKSSHRWIFIIPIIGWLYLGFFTLREYFDPQYFGWDFLTYVIRVFIVGIVSFVASIYALRYSYVRYKKTNNLVITKFAVFRMVIFLSFIIASIYYIANL